MNTIFHSSSIPNGHSWTIVTKLGCILLEAEKRFGERDKSYTILGIEINDLDYPQIWYPGNRKDIVIQITKDCLTSINRAVYQVAHEVVHCLFPIQGQKTNILEEGLATHFSIEYCKMQGHGEWIPENKKYEEARIIVEEVLAFDKDIIKKLRRIQPTISLSTKEDIHTVSPNIPMELVNKLIQEF